MLLKVFSDMTRRLSRRSKDLACMRQLGRCAYCSELLSDAMQTDHMDENRSNDSWHNLACACGTCHANKSQHYRLRRHTLLHSMLDTARKNKAQWATEWADEGREHYEELPEWLQCRVSRLDARSHHVRQRIRLRPPSPTLNLEKYCYKPSG